MDQQEQMRYFYEIFDASLPRLGPGDDASTLKALDMALSAMGREKTQQDKKNLRVLDVGCGTGTQTIRLARHIEGEILAVDNHQPFLDELKRRAEAEGVYDRIRPWLKDMGSLKPDDGPFDLIWSEGALYAMGFKQGLSMCRSLLRRGGCLAVTELCWLKSSPPAECREFLENEYPDIRDVDGNLAAVRGAGYELLGHFILPESAWLQSFYNPLEERLRHYSEDHASDKSRMEVAGSIQTEIDMYRKHGMYYGYVFLVAQKTGV